MERYDAVRMEGVEDSFRMEKNVPCLKLTAKTPENERLEDDRFLLGPGLFSGTILVSGRVHTTWISSLLAQRHGMVIPNNPQSARLDSSL